MLKNLALRCEIDFSQISPQFREAASLHNLERYRNITFCINGL